MATKYKHLHSTTVQLYSIFSCSSWSPETSSKLLSHVILSKVCFTNHFFSFIVNDDSSPFLSNYCLKDGVCLYYLKIFTNVKIFWATWQLASVFQKLLEKHCSSKMRTCIFKASVFCNLLCNKWMISRQVKMKEVCFANRPNRNLVLFFCHTSTKHRLKCMENKVLSTPS